MTMYVTISFVCDPGSLLGSSSMKNWSWFGANHLERTVEGSMPLLDIPNTTTPRVYDRRRFTVLHAFFTLLAVLPISAKGPRLVHVPYVTGAVVTS